MIQFNSKTNMTDSDQKGVSLIVTLLMTTIILSVVLGISAILFNQVKITGNTGNSLSSLNAADSGSEKTLYFDRKQIPPGGNRGICNICSACLDCSNCVTVPLEPNGCDSASCTNCQVTYDSTFDDKAYTVDAKVTPDILNPPNYIFNIIVKGFYRDTIRAIELTSGQ